MTRTSQQKCIVRVDVTNQNLILHLAHWRREWTLETHAARQSVRGWPCAGAASECLREGREAPLGDNNARRTELPAAWTWQRGSFVEAGGGGRLSACPFGVDICRKADLSTQHYTG